MAGLSTISKLERQFGHHMESSQQGLNGKQSVMSGSRTSTTKEPSLHVPLLRHASRNLLLQLEDAPSATQIGQMRPIQAREPRPSQESGIIRAGRMPLLGQSDTASLGRQSSTTKTVRYGLEIHLREHHLGALCLAG